MGDGAQAIEQLTEPLLEQVRARPNMPGRVFCLSLADQEAYWSLLRAAFPEVRCYVDPPHSATTGPEPPGLEIRETLPAPGPYFSTEIIFDGHWTPRWEPRTRNRWWTIANMPYPNACFERGGGVSPGGFLYRNDPASYPPSITSGRIYFRCRKGSKADMAVARKCLRLLTKVASNRVQTVEFPSLKVVARVEKGSDFWIGHDAARWCREDPARMAYYLSGPNVGYRPLD